MNIRRNWGNGIPYSQLKSGLVGFFGLQRASMLSGSEVIPGSTVLKEKPN